MVQSSYTKSPGGGEKVSARQLRVGDKTIYGDEISDLVEIDGGQIVLVKYGARESSWFRRDETVELMTRGPA